MDRALVSIGMGATESRGAALSAPPRYRIVMAADAPARSAVCPGAYVNRHKSLDRPLLWGYQSSGGKANVRLAETNR